MPDDGDEEYSIFKEEIVKNPDICNNCYRKFRDRMIPEAVNHKGERVPIRTSIKSSVRDKNDYSSYDTKFYPDKTTKKEVPYCKCGIQKPGFSNSRWQRPLSKSQLLECVHRIREHLTTSQDIELNEDLLYDTFRALKEDPDNQFEDDQILKEAVDTAAITEKGNKTET